MLEAIQKFRPGQVVGPFEVVSIAGRDSRNKLPIYNVKCSRCLTPTTIKHRAVVLKCRYCELQTTREALAQSPALTAKLNEIRHYDAQVDADYAARKVNPEAPAPVQPPQPS